MIYNFTLSRIVLFLVTFIVLLELSICDDSINTTKPENGEVDTNIGKETCILF